MEATEVVYSPHTGLVMASSAQTGGYLHPIATDALWVDVDSHTEISVMSGEDKTVVESLSPDGLTVWLEPTARVRVVGGDVDELPSYRQPGVDALDASINDSIDELPFPITNDHR